MKRQLIPCLLMVLVMGLTACSSTNAYGRFSLSSDVAKAFNAYEVNPAYRYYISGSDVHPNALLGLDRSYRLNPATLWKEVRMTPEKMKEIVQGMKTEAFDFWRFPDGYVLTDEQGHSVGVWYSIREAVTFVRTEKDGALTIDTPPLDTYLRLEMGPERPKRK